jgi:uncharacterized phosphosugar-binding protein
MASFAEQYIDGVISLLQRMRDEESESIRQAANIMADAIEGGKRIFGFGATHSSLPVQDIVYRAGGLLLVNPLFGPGIASLDIFPATISSHLERLEGYAKVLLDNSPLQEGDVLILVSVSGRNAVPIELAQLARERGIQVIGVTSREYTEGVTSRHPSGKKMIDFAHVVLDNKVPKGDAILEAEGMKARFTPASGVTSNALLHALVSATIEELLARGITPPVAIAANVDGGEEHNARIFEEYKDRIFYI